MRREFLTGNEAAAWAARLCRPDFIPNYPITPQTELIETLAKWHADGQLDADFCMMESEHSVMSAAVGASAAGARVYTATSSQGLELMHEVMYIASGMRLPIVLNNVSRALSAPITLWSDHNDFLGLRDTGWILFHAQDNQEVLDSTIMAFKIAEDSRVLLPACVNMDGYVLSYTMEPTLIPPEQTIGRFVGKYDPKHAFFDVDHPLVQGIAIMNPEDYTRFRLQHHKASLNVKEVTKEVCRKWQKLTGRGYDVVERFCLDDAEMALVTQGSVSTTAKAAVLKMRKEGWKVGLLRLRLIRPLPRDEIAAALLPVDGIAVVDKNLAPGLGGIMYPEICECVFDAPERPIVSSFIMGLGGKPESVKDFEEIVKALDKDMDDETSRVRFV